MSRRLGDKPSLAETLAAAFWSRGPRTNEQVNEMLLESSRSRASSTISTSRATRSHGSSRRRSRSATTTPRATGSRRPLSSARLLSEPFLLHVTEQYRSALDLCDGDLDGGGGRCHALARVGPPPDGTRRVGDVRDPDVRPAAGAGPPGGLAPVVRLLGSSARDGAWRPGLIAVLAELGMVEEARRELDRLLDDGIGTCGRRSGSPRSCTSRTPVPSLRDESRRRRSTVSSTTHEGSNAMIGHLVACYGATDRYLGMNAAVLGEWERAEGHFEAALALNARLGARTWLAHTAYEYGRMLLARGAERRPSARAGAARRRGRTGADDRAADAPRADRGAARGRRARRAAPGRAQPA